MNKLDDILPQPVNNDAAKQVIRQKQQIKALMLELINDETTDDVHFPEGQTQEELAIRLRRKIEEL